MIRINVNVGELTFAAHSIKVSYADIVCIRWRYPKVRFGLQMNSDTKGPEKIAITISGSERSRQRSSIKFAD